MYGCESWTIKKAEHRRADAFELWCWRRLLRESLGQQGYQTSLSLQLCLTLCDPMDCHKPGSSVYGILQARILEWVAISSSRKSSQPRDQTLLSPVASALQADSLPLSHWRSWTKTTKHKTSSIRHYWGKLTVMGPVAYRKIYPNKRPTAFELLSADCCARMDSQEFQSC